MTRGTTPTHTFTLPPQYTNTIFSSLFVTYKQNDVIVEKELNDTGVTRTGCLITVKLSQSETLKFSANNLEQAKVQLRAKTNDGTVLASKIMFVPIEDILKEGEI